MGDSRTPILHQDKNPDDKPELFPQGKIDYDICDKVKEFFLQDMDISFVIPCYRSQDTIGEVVSEIDMTMAEKPSYKYEIILVSDGSPDDVWQVISNLTKDNDRIIGVNLAKNFGQHCAILAGYHYAKGDIIITMDDDGQTPACEVFTLIDKINEGYDVVYASYEEYHQTFIRKMGSAFTNKLAFFMLDVKEDYPNPSSYHAMRRFVKEEVIRYDHPYPYVMGLIFRTTRNVAMVKVNHRDRIKGSSGYNFRSLVSLWLNGFTAFSVKPLEMGVFLGFGFSVFGILFAILTIIRKILIPGMQAGWSSIISAVMIIGGIILIMLGLIGEYVGRIYICLNNSPQFVVKETVGTVKMKE